MRNMLQNVKEKVCFVIPIHPPNYRFLPNLEKIVRKTGVEIFLVLTEQDPYIEQKYSCFEYIHFNRLQKKDVTNWPTEKKFLGSKWVFDTIGYKYVITCDAEIKLDKVFNHDELFKICDDFFYNKRIYGGGNSADIFQKINEDCMEFLGFDEKCIKKYKDIYFWFSELPIYEKTTFIEFFEEQNLGKRSYVFNHYDHLLYSYWLFLNKDFSIIDWNKLTSNQTMKVNCSGELICSNSFFDMLKEHGIELHWLSFNYARHIKRNYVLLKYHVDRLEQRYTISKLKKVLRALFRLNSLYK